MSDKCTHDSTIVEYDGGNVQVERCTWACGQTLISVKKTNGVTVTMTYQELAALTERVGRLEKLKAAAESLSGFYYQTESEDGSDCYWVDKNYSIVSENDGNRYAFLTSKQIADRRFQRALQEAQ